MVSMKGTMMKLLLSLVVAAGFTTGSALASTSPTAYPGHELSSGAKLTLNQARAAAHKARAGRIVEQELEKEAGGSGLRYSFDINSRGRTFEVGIDAMTGAVLENGHEGRAKEAAESRADRAAKAPAKHG